ncbi:unnamed protein product [Caenorhabditis sp. 36 PRJEB53466]|nr:unnamed protein product [Caenorhabditis sp. 36 PRJEB53466]
MNFLFQLLFFFGILSCIKNEKFSAKLMNISISDDCENLSEAERLFGQRDNHYKDPSGNIFCFRKRDGVARMSSTSVLFEDPRFVCSNGPMSWYRGRRNIDFKNRPCLFWSIVPNSTFDISDGSSSSFSMKRILPDEYENFCRNPDDNHLGPWCYVADGIQAPCFEPCKPFTDTSSKFTCLNKEGFPYTANDMSDILDLPQLIQSFDYVHLMYESRYVISGDVDRRSTKSCMNTGPIADFFGPWIAVFDEVAKKLLKGVGRRVLRDLCAPEPPTENELELLKSGSSAIRDAIFEDELTVAGCSFWKRCFTSCQDDASNCWDENTSSGYFGSKTTTVEKRTCLPWAQVASDILSVSKKNSTMHSKYHLYHSLLFDDPNEFFVESRLFMNTEQSCMLLNRRNSTEQKYWFPQNVSGRTRMLCEAE